MLISPIFEVDWYYLKVFIKELFAEFTDSITVSGSGSLKSDTLERMGSCGEGNLGLGCTAYSIIIFSAGIDCLVPI